MFRRHLIATTVGVLCLLFAVGISFAEYFIGPGDLISIDVIPFTRGFYGTYLVDDNGYIASYYFDKIYVNGLTSYALADELEGLYSQYLLEPHVVVSIERAINNRYVVIGDVWRPGVYGWIPNLTIAEAIAYAGGGTYSALLWDVKVIRGDMNNPQIISVNVDDIFKGTDLSTNIQVERGDIIYIPRTMIARVNKLLDQIIPSINMIIRGNQLVDIFTE